MARERLIDWSKYNGNTDLRKAVEAWGIIGLMARCTIGYSYADPYYEHNFIQAQELGLLFGAYHVLYPWNRNPSREVGWFKDHMIVNGKIPDFVIGDLELPKDPVGWKTITPKEVAQQIVVLLPEMRNRTGLETFGYTGSWWWNGEQMVTVTPLGIEGSFKLIEAEYVSQTPCGKVDWPSAPQEPKYPSLGRGWTKADLVMWQWTSCLKPVGNGADGSKTTDGDVLIPTYEQFLAIIHKTQPVSDAEKLDRLWDHHPELWPPSEG